MSNLKPIKLAILWHMHQPDYHDPDINDLSAPWVRLHATKDYLDMLVWATKYRNIKVTFNLVPSLIEQLDHYNNGGTDQHLEFTRANPSQLNDTLKIEILRNMFKCNFDKMIAPNKRFFELQQKWEKYNKDKLHGSFTDEEIRDAQVWSNLAWVDPLFKNEEPVKQLFEKEKLFSENEKQLLIQWQLNHIRKIIPAYKYQLESGSIEISFSPYFHPILPLLCNSETAKEALPEITLPKNLFKHPEDARKQVDMSLELFESLFKSKMSGMWPSEGSLSDEAINICAASGLSWLASDEQVLYRSLQKNNMSTTENHPYRAYKHGSGIKLLFRDHTISDKIGFVYSTWEPERAVDDFITHLKNVRARLSHVTEDITIPVILDGENCWEFYPNDGSDFLNILYQKISNDSEIETVTMSQAVERSFVTELESVFAGSWINHNFRIWIGHEEDNLAWTHLKNARDFLTKFESQNPNFDRQIIEQCWRHIFVAEGSDWFWWYGDEHRGQDNHRFDSLFRKNLKKIYKLLNINPPFDLNVPIISQGRKPQILLPDALVTPQIDGKISHFYEWFGAGKFQCTGSDSTMHRIYQLCAAIHFGFDHDNFYARVDFTNPDLVRAVSKLSIELVFEVPEEKRVSLDIPKLPFKTDAQSYKGALDDVLELEVKRNFLWTESSGVLAFRIELYDKDELLEKWPENGSILLEIPEKNKELFWH